MPPKLDAAMGETRAGLAASRAREAKQDDSKVSLV
jgi:hypothetical protein